MQDYSVVKFKFFFPSSNFVSNFMAKNLQHPMNFKFKVMFCDGVPIIGDVASSNKSPMAIPSCVNSKYVFVYYQHEKYMV